MNLCDCGTEGKISGKVTIADGGDTITPSEDGKVEVPEGGTLKPANGPAVTRSENSKVDGTGSVTIPSGGTATIPGNGSSGKTKITVPGDGILAPTGQTTRAEAAIMLMRYLENCKKSK